MSLVLLETLKAQRKVTYAIEDSLLQGYLDAADLHVQNFLNRNVYASQPELDAAITAAPTALAAARDAYAAAYAAWQLLPDSSPDLFAALNNAYNQPVLGAPQTANRDFASVAYDKLIGDWRRAIEQAQRTYGGKVITPNISQAIVLLAAGWDANREYVITELSNAIELPMGVVALLSPDRVRQGV